MRPPVVIGISSYARGGEPPVFSLPCGYVDGVRLAGAIPVIFPPGEPSAARLLDRVDGLILAGGGDISPAAYGGEPHETIYSVCDERDAFELDLARTALARHDRPVLSICRGLQLLNVVCGGTLHEHIPDAFGDTVPHRAPPRVPVRHPVTVAPDSHLAGVLGATRVEAISWHHQSVDRLGGDLRPVAWAEDGVIEAVEHLVHPWCLAVQWHPELQLDDPAQRRLFQAFIAAVDGARPTARTDG